MTLQGFTNNAEIITRNSTLVTDGLSNESKSVLEILNQMISDDILEDDNVKKIIDQINTKLGRYAELPNRQIQILHNIKDPIIHQIFNIVKETEFEELFVLAPFISEGSELIQAILDKFRIKKFTLALQRGNHNLSDIKNFKDACNSHGTIFSLQEAKFIENDIEDIVIPRRFHAKVVALKGDNSYLLAGSPNFTAAALLNTTKTGNCECGIFWKNPDFIILEQIHTTTPSNATDLLSSSRSIAFHPVKSIVEIKSIFFDSISKELVIKTEPINKTYLVKFKINEDRFHPVIENCNFSSGIISKSFHNMTPYEIEIESDNQIIKRRIFGDIDPVRRMLRGGFSMRTLTENLGEILTLDRSALFSILGVISSMSDAEFGVPHEKITKSLNEEREYYAGRERHSSNFNRFLNQVSDVLVSLDVIKKSTKEIEDFGTDEDVEEITEHEGYSRSIDPYKIFRDITKLVKNIHSILSDYYQKIENENAIDGIITFIATFLQFAPYLSSTETFSFQASFSETEELDEKKDHLIELFESKLDDLFTSVSIRDILTAHNDNLLLHLICLEMTTGISIKNENLKKCLLKIDLLNKEGYLSIKDKAKEYSIVKQIEFRDELFEESYFSYAYNILQLELTKNIEKLCLAIENETDDKFLSSLKFLLTKIRKNYSPYTFNNIKYNKNSPGGKIIYDIIGDSVELDPRMGNPWYRGD